MPTPLSHVNHFKRSAIKANDNPKIQDITREEVAPQFREVGVLLFRGFGCDVKDFEDFSEAMSDRILIHHSHKRKILDNKGKTTSVTAGVTDFGLHRERSMLPAAPDILFFYCGKPAETGGETTVCDGAELFDRLTPKTQNFLRSNRFSHFLRLEPEHWSKAFEADTCADAVEGLKGLAAKMSPGEEIKFEIRDQAIEINYKYPCLQQARYTTRETFCNGLLLYLVQIGDDRRKAYFEGRPFDAPGTGFVLVEDGTPFPEDVFGEIKETSDELTHGVQWQKGDIVMIDNSRFIHGRTGFTGEREILFRMSQADYNNK